MKEFEVFFPLPHQFLPKTQLNSQNPFKTSQAQTSLKKLLFLNSFLNPQFFQKIPHKTSKYLKIL